MDRRHSPAIDAFAKKHNLNISLSSNIVSRDGNTARFTQSPIIILGWNPGTDWGLVITDPRLSRVRISPKDLKKVEKYNLLRLQISREFAETFLRPLGFVGTGDENDRWGRILAKLGFEYEMDEDPMYLFSSDNQEAVDMIFVMAQIGSSDKKPKSLEHFDWEKPRFLDMSEGRSIYNPIIED